MEYIDKGIQASELEKQYGINTNTINTWVYKYRHKSQLKDERGRPKESFHSLLKKETLYNNNIKSLDHYVKLVIDWISFYNTSRISL
jgi:transposase-like protein